MRNKKTHARRNEKKATWFGHKISLPPFRSTLIPLFAAINSEMLLIMTRYCHICSLNDRRRTAHSRYAFSLKGQKRNFTHTIPAYRTKYHINSSTRPHERGDTIAFSEHLACIANAHCSTPFDPLVARVYIIHILPAAHRDGAELWIVLRRVHPASMLSFVLVMAWRSANEPTVWPPRRSGCLRTPNGRECGNVFGASIGCSHDWIFKLLNSNYFQ